MGDRYVVYKNLFNENIRKRLKNKNKIFKLNLNGKKDLIIKVVFIIIYTLIIGFFLRSLNYKYGKIGIFLIWNMFAITSNIEFRNENKQNKIIKNEMFCTSNFSMSERIRICIFSTRINSLYENISVIISSSFYFILYYNIKAVIYIIVFELAFFLTKSAKIYKRLIKEKGYISKYIVSLSLILKVIFSVAFSVITLKCMDFFIEKILFMRQNIKSIGELLNYSLDEKYYQMLFLSKFKEIFNIVTRDEKVYRFCLLVLLCAIIIELSSCVILEKRLRNRKHIKNLKKIDYIGKIFEPKNFFLKKDIKIIYKTFRKNLIETILNVVFPLDFLIKIIVWYKLEMSINNQYLSDIVTIVVVMSNCFSGIGTIRSVFEKVFMLEDDWKMLDLYKMSKYKIKDLIISKIRLAGIFYIANAILTIIASIVIFLNSKAFGWKGLIITFFTTIIFGLVASVMYHYPYIVCIKHKIEDLEDDKIYSILHKMTSIPQNLYLLPMIYVLIINCIGSWINGVTWKNAEYIYLGYIIILSVMMFTIIKKIFKENDF